MNRKSTTSIEQSPAFADTLAKLVLELERLPNDETVILLPYIATPVDEALRRRLEQFLLLHPELNQEAAWSYLLDLGLQRAHELAVRAPR